MNFNHSNKKNKLDTDYLIINKKDTNRIKIRLISGLIQWDDVGKSFIYQDHNDTIEDTNTTDSHESSSITVEDIFSSDFCKPFNMSVEDIAYSRFKFYDEDNNDKKSSDLISPLPSSTNSPIHQNNSNTNGNPFGEI